MTAPAGRHAPFRRTLVLLGGTALVVLVALAGLLAGSGIADPGRSVAPVVHVHSLGVALGADHHHGAEPLSSIHPAISTRAPRIAFVLPAAAVAAVAWIFQRLRRARSGRLRALGVFGLPPGRAPPALRIA
jgi:hypothetical protein